MTSALRTRYVIDRAGRIVSVDDAWLAFARENDAPELTRERVLGRSLWDFVEGEDTRRVYRGLFARVRREGIRVRLPFRCDGPDVRRFMRLEARPAVEGGVELACVLERRDRQPPMRILARSAARGPDVLEVCSLCRRVALPAGGWVEPEDAAARLDLPERGPVPVLRHAVCLDCRGLVDVALAQAGAAAAPRDSRR